MCLLLHHKEGISLTKDQFDDFIKHNPHGWGGMYAKDGKIRYLKTFQIGEPGYAIYQEYFDKKDCVLHFRQATHGKQDKANTHPFHVSKNIMAAHNGIFSMGNPIHDNKSDTWHFCKYVLSPMLKSNPKLLEDASWVKYMERLIGTMNRIALLRNDGYLVILNKIQGTDHKGCWYSNTYSWSSPVSHFSYGYGYTHWDSNDMRTTPSVRAQQMYQDYERKKALLRGITEEEDETESIYGRLVSPDYLNITIEHADLLGCISFDVPDEYDITEDKEDPIPNDREEELEYWREVQEGRKLLTTV